MLSFFYKTTTAPKVLPLYRACKAEGLQLTGSTQQSDAGLIKGITCLRVAAHAHYSLWLHVWFLFDLQICFPTCSSLDAQCAQSGTTLLYKQSVASGSLNILHNCCVSFRVL
jgi:hypothetical protein